MTNIEEHLVCFGTKNDAAGMVDDRTAAQETGAAIDGDTDGAEESCVEEFIRAGLSGSTTVDPVSRHVSRREIQLTAEVRAQWGTEACTAVRAHLLRLMDPLTDVELTADMGAGERRIALIPSGGSSVELGHYRTPVTARLCFIAPDPYFAAVVPETVYFWEATPMLAFPLNPMAGAGTVSGYYRTTNAAKLKNPGDRECGYRLMLTAENGVVENPSVTLPGGTLSLRCAFGEGEHVVIDTHPRTKTILVNGVPSLCFMPGSVFAGIPRGTSDMVLTAENGIQYLRAQLSFVPLYYGV